jgi:hypothetical protein
MPKDKDRPLLDAARERRGPVAAVRAELENLSDLRLTAGQLSSRTDSAIC